KENARVGCTLSYVVQWSDRQLSHLVRRSARFQKLPRARRQVVCDPATVGRERRSQHRPRFDIPKSDRLLVSDGKYPQPKATWLAGGVGQILAVRGPRP